MNLNQKSADAVLVETASFFNSAFDSELDDCATIETLANSDNSVSVITFFIIY